MIPSKINFSGNICTLVLLAATLLLWRPSRTQTLCSPGCLICSSSAKCSLCDVENSYVLNSSSECETQSLPNCRLSFAKDKCHMCQSPYYVSSGECVEVEADKQIKGCLVYASSSTCSVCSDDYFLKSGSCESLTAERKVSGCLQFSEEGCDLCLFGFQNHLKNKCSIGEDMDMNCQFYYEGQKCLTCAEGYQLNYSVLSGADESAYKKVFEQNLLFGTEKLGALPQNMCYKVNDSGSNQKALEVACAENLTLSEACVQCDSAKSYFDFRSRQCLANPQVPQIENIHQIDNCLAQNLNFECVLCYNGYYMLHSKKRCFKHTTSVENCLVMSQDIDSHCLACKSTHYLVSATNSCTLRTQTVEQCDQHDIFAERCTVCAANHSLQDNATKCLPVPADCLEPVPGTTAPLSCAKCADNYHLFDGQCMQIPAEYTVANCVQYSKSTPATQNDPVQFTCAKCDSSYTLVQSKFLLSGNHTPFDGFTAPGSVADEQKRECVLKSLFYRDVAGCDEFVDGECVTCSEGGTLYSVENQCEKLETGQTEFIEGCQVYADDGTCKQCIYSYKNETDGKCYTSDLTNCRYFKPSQVVTDTPHCIYCNEGFALHNGNCYDLRSAEADISNCLLYNEHRECVYCASGYINNFASSQTQGLSKSHKCFDRRVFLSHANAADILSCESFEKKDNGSIECFSCIKGYELNKTGQCVPCLPHFVKSNSVDSFVYDEGSSSFYCKNDFSPSNNDCLYFSSESHDRCLLFRKGVSCAYFLDELDNRFSYKEYPALTMSFFGDLKGSNWRHSRPADISQFPCRLTRKVVLSNPNSKLKNYLFQNNTDFANSTVLSATCHLGYARDFSGISMQADDCNTIVKNCDVRARIFYPGRTGHLISCSRCFKSNLTVYFTLDQINKSLLPDIDQHLQRGYTTSHLPSTFCYKDDLPAAVAHCGVYQLSANGASYTQTCRACQPGFKPSYDLQDATKVTVCEAIEFCEFSSVADICEICKSGYGFKTESNVTKTRQTCSLIIGQVESCLEWNGDQNAPACVKCRPGFNSPGSLCKKSIYGDCSHFDDEGNCLKCESLHQISYITNVVKEVQTGCFLGTYSRLPFCEVQYTENKCFRCFTGFMKDSEGRCFSIYSVPNCAEYDVISLKCVVCAAEFYLDADSGRCVPLLSLSRLPTQALDTSANCQGAHCHVSFDWPYSVNDGHETINASVGISNCEFLDDDKLRSSQKIECLKCKNTFKLKANAPAKKCLSFEPLLNCQTQEFDSNLMLRCVTCEDGYFLATDGRCRSRNNMPKCVSYYPNLDSCRECEKDFYLDLNDNNTCKNRFNKDDKCLTYFEYKDACQIYQPKYQYISQRLYDAVRVPPSNALETSGTSAASTGDKIGIPGCTVYFSKFICSECDSGTYLHLNQCRAVSKSIEHCVRYSGKSTCSRCDEGYLLSDNECKLILTTNCLVYESETKCRSCTFENPILKEDFSCGKNPDVPNCKLYSSPNKCQICDEGFFLTVDAKCISVSAPVANCENYSSTGTCASCSRGFELKASACSKIVGVDPFCSSAVTTTNRCALCKAGYVLVGDVCQKCGAANPGCAVCDAENRDECKMCASGYTMDDQKKCHANQVIWDSYIKISYDI